MLYARPTRLGQILRWLAAVGLIAVTPVLAWYAWATYQTAKATAAWPAATGVVTRAEIRQVSRERFATEVAYAYQVDGRAYTGRRIRLADAHYRHGAAKAALMGLAIGQHRAVYYNPADPADAMLLPGAVSGEAWLMILPAFTFAGGLAILVWLVRNWGNPNARVLRESPW